MNIGFAVSFQTMMITNQSTIILIIMKLATIKMMMIIHIVT